MLKKTHFTGNSAPSSKPSKHSSSSTVNHGITVVNPGSTIFFD